MVRLRSWSVSGDVYSAYVELCGHPLFPASWNSKTKALTLNTQLSLGDYASVVQAFARLKVESKKGKTSPGGDFVVAWG